MTESQRETRQLRQLPNGDMMYVGGRPSRPTVASPAPGEDTRPDPIESVTASANEGSIACPWCGMSLAAGDVRGHVTSLHASAIGSEANAGRARALEASRQRAGGRAFGKAAAARGE